MESGMARVGCGALIRRNDGRVLLVRRRRMPEADHWGVPGGKIEWMEAVEQAVRREISEETGLVLGDLTLLCVVDHFEKAGETPQHWLAPVYLAEPVDPEAASLREPEALSGIAWFSLDALPAPLTRATLTAVHSLKCRGL